jgi:olefin beta-lactone synthetase
MSRPVPDKNSEIGEMGMLGILPTTNTKKDFMHDDGTGAYTAYCGDVCNMAANIKKTAGRKPFAKAVVFPAGKDKDGRTAYSHLTYAQLDELSDRYAHGLVEAGIRRGTKTIVMVRPCIEFFGIMLGLYKAGAVPVLVDPGMGVLRMMHCHRSSGAEAFIGIPVAHLLRVLAPWYFKSVRTFITVGRRWFWGGLTARQMRERPWKPFAIEATGRNELAMIAFTTGSTGPAKGVCYTHGMMDAQLEILSKEYTIGDNEVSLATFPAFALFDCGLGATSVIPDMDPTRPARVDPLNIIEPILNHGVTYLFGSPALVKRVALYCAKNRVKLPSLRVVLTGGAPVAPGVVGLFKSLMSENGEIYTPYGATESLPISTIGGTEILSETRRLTESGRGVCLGRPALGTRIQVIKITDAPIPAWSGSLLAGPEEIGEIVIAGPQVSGGYFNLPQADSAAKIADGETRWHRMGDVGWIDGKGRVWMCGRKSQRVVTIEGDMFTIPCESVFNRHPKVFRSALVGIGPCSDRTPVICIETVPGVKRSERGRIREELMALARGSDLTKNISHILFRRRFPVDVRHNAKIIRERLSKWAEKKIRSPWREFITTACRRADQNNSDII